MLLGDFGLDLWYRPIWSWTIHILTNFPSQIYSMAISEMHTAPGVCLLYALEQYAFQMWSWSICNLENSWRLLMVQDHKVLMIQDHMVMVLNHKLRPKSPKRLLYLNSCGSYCPFAFLGVVHRTKWSITLINMIRSPFCMVMLAVHLYVCIGMPACSSSACIWWQVQPRSSGLHCLDKDKWTKGIVV